MRFVNPFAHIGWFKFASKFAASVPIMLLLLVMYWLVPRFSFKDEGSLGTSDQDQVRRFTEEVNSAVKEANLPEPTDRTPGPAKPRFVPRCEDCYDYRETTLALTPLVGLLVKIPIDVSSEYDYTKKAFVRSYRTQKAEYYATVRVDNVVLLFLVIVGITLGFRAIRFTPMIAYPSDAPSTAERASAESYLETDVLKAEERARDIYKRSTILLGGGIVMAFVGVALFYVTLPSAITSSSDSLSFRELAREEAESRYRYLELRDYVERQRIRPFDPAPNSLGRSQLSEEHPWLTFASHSLRPTGMLIFMEGIAWFLLRQYRVLIGEYKAFLRVYLKRSSYLIAWKAASASADRQFAVAHAMMNEDAQGTLKKDETTEILETMRLSEPTPIVEVLREVKALIPALPKK